MKNRNRRTSKTASLCMLFTISATSFNLLMAATDAAQAQSRLTTIPTAPPPTANGPKITKIIVTGNKILSSSAIIIMSGHAVGDVYSQQTIDEMRENLTNSGYFGIQRNPDDRDSWVKIQAEEANGENTVIINVDENDQIKNIQVTGSGPVKAEDIISLLHLKPGSIYNPLFMRRDDLDIEKKYNSLGYIAILGQDETLDPKTGVLTIPIVVTRVAEIKIEKTKKTKRTVIIREMKTKVGDYFNRKKWNDDLQRVYNLNLFDDVVPREDLIGTGQVRLTLSLPEKRTGNISVGAGYSSREQLIGRAEISETNFRGMGETLSLLLESGGVANTESIELSFVEPWLDHKHTALAVQVYDKTIYRFANSLVDTTTVSNQVGTSTHYNEQRVGSTVTVSRPVGRRYLLAISGRAEDVHTNSLDLGGIDASILQNGPIYVLGSTMQHDTRDVPLDPVVGGYQSLGIQLGHSNLYPPATPDPAIDHSVYGNHDFSKISLEERQFFSLSGPRKKPTDSKRVLAFRFLMGTSVGTLPFFEQYFVGGAETLRGYREDRFWGSSMFLTSLEYRQPMGKALTGVLFTDVGDAWGGKYSNVNINGFSQSGFHPHPAIGIGIRVRTPLGPIRLDYGYGDEGGQTHFSIGNVF